MSWLEVLRMEERNGSGILHPLHDAEAISAPNELNVFFAEMVSEKLSCKIDSFRGICDSRNASVSIKVGTNAYVFHSCYIRCMYQVGDGILYGGFSVSAEEAWIQSDLHHAPYLGKSLHLFICEISRMVA